MGTGSDYSETFCTSYNLVTVSGNIIRRNRRHLKPTQKASQNAAPQVDDDNIDFSVPPAPHHHHQDQHN